MVGHIVFEGINRQGKAYVIRYPKEGDAEAMCAYINTLSQERTFIRFQGEQITLEEEEKYLDGLLKKILDKKAVPLLVVSETKVVGMAAIEMKDRTESHEGVLGISLAKEIRGEGIGKTLMRVIIEEAEKQLPQLRLITLGVLDSNHIGRKMYSNFGFQEYGRLPEGIFHQDKYVDHIFLYKKVR